MLKKVHTKQRFATNKDIKKLYNKKKSCTIDSEGSYQRRGFFFFQRRVLNSGSLALLEWIYSQPSEVFALKGTKLV